MPLQKIKTQTTLCPNCFLYEGIDTPLRFTPGSDLMHHCDKGHSYPDSDELHQRANLMNAKKRALKDAESEDLEEKPKTKPKPAPTDGIKIVEDDRLRIESIVGPFSDGSSLFGAIFALKDQIEDLKVELANAQTAHKTAVSKIPGAKPKVAGGDTEVIATIPADHVAPLQAIAEANNMDWVVYFNSVVDHGLKSGWFY